MAKGKEVNLEEEQGVALGKRLYNLCIVLFGSALLIALAYQLLFPPTAAPTASSNKGEIITKNAESLKKGNAQDNAQEHDLFSGQWIKDASGPTYTNSSCSFISHPQDCLTNGRPDTDYLYWRWKPYGCELPPFDPRKFLNNMRHKSFAFIGDSIFRNQMESLLCLLSKVEEAVLVYYDEKYQSKTWYLPSHNVTLGLIWAPFLIKSTEPKSKKNLQLYLDVLDDTWTSQYKKFDYILLSGGQWFLKETIFWENDTIVGCHYCSGKNLKELGMDYSYRKALELVFDFMSTSDHKPIVILKTWTPSHFEYGKWYNGGICNRTNPFKDGQSIADPVDETMRDVELEAFHNGLKKGIRLKLLDTYHLSVLRPDGHPGPYRRFHPDLSEKPQQDCLHWCLPGPIDTWNDLFMAILMEGSELRAAF